MSQLQSRRLAAILAADIAGYSALMVARMPTTSRRDERDGDPVFATWSFRVGIEGGDIPLGASVSLFMVPILTIAAIFILRDITKRGSEV